MTPSLFLEHHLHHVLVRALPLLQPLGGSPPHQGGHGLELGGLVGAEGAAGVLPEGPKVTVSF